MATRREIPNGETADRRGVLRWMADRTQREAARALQRPPSWYCEWLQHKAELRDEEIEHWVETTGVSRRTFLEGRYESRLRARDEAAA